MCFYNWTFQLVLDHLILRAIIQQITTANLLGQPLQFQIDINPCHVSFDPTYKLVCVNLWFAFHILPVGEKQNQSNSLYQTLVQNLNIHGL